MTGNERMYIYIVVRYPRCRSGIMKREIAAGRPGRRAPVIIITQLDHKLCLCVCVSPLVRFIIISAHSTTLSISRMDMCVRLYVYN